MKVLRLAALALFVGLAGMASAQEDQPAYLDDRSTPHRLVQSYFNAISRFEHTRAFSYLRPDAGIGYDQWQFHFDDVTRAEAVLGHAHHDARAGEIYYSIPIILILYHAEGDSHIEIGCMPVTWPLVSTGDPLPYAFPTMGPGRLERFDGNPRDAAFPNCAD